MPTLLIWLATTFWNPNPCNPFYFYPVYITTQTSCVHQELLYWWPDPLIMFQTCLTISYLVQTVVKAMWKAFVDGLINNWMIKRSLF